MKLALVALLCACKSKHPQVAHDDAGRDATVHDAAPDAPGPWRELADKPVVQPVRSIALPSRPDVPRFEVGGPTVVGDIAVVSSSQFGFVGVDWRRGAIAWTKPAGLHVAPPVARDSTAVLIGECANPPDLVDTLVGCMRVVTPTGSDLAYQAIHGKQLTAFAEARGAQATWLVGDRTVRWRRGDQAIDVDLITGVAKPARTDAPPLHITYGKRAWDITQVDGKIVARGTPPWQTKRAYTSLIGAVYLADLAPMVRAVNAGTFGGIAELTVFDIDATGSLHGEVGFPVPGIALLGSSIDAVGNTALVVQLDASLRRDYVAAYAANALLMYVAPLPEVAHVDPIGIAIAPDAVLVFHDGDTFTILPELSTPPTAPGAPRVPSQIPTP